MWASTSLQLQPIKQTRPTSFLNPARMDTHGLTRFPKSPTSNRFLLRDYPCFSPPNSSANADVDLSEDDIFATDFSEPNDLHHLHQHGLHHFHHHNNDFSKSFGILAALPKPCSHSHFYHKSSSSSSSRTIPSHLKPTQELAPAFGKYNQHQSAPVKVPMLTNAMKKSRYLEEDEDDYVVGGKLVLPPHEMVERRQPAVACSVVEGAGRTLKGRDLRQVRNAVWRQTGFMD